MDINKLFDDIEPFVDFADGPHVNELWQTLKAAVLAQQTTNSRVMQLPTLAGVLKHVYCAPDRNSSHVASVVASAYDYIVSRQQL